MGEIGFLSRSAMAEPRHESDKLPRNLGLASILMAALALDGPDPSTPMMSGFQYPDPHCIDDQNVLPQREDGLTYLARFIDEVCVFYPYLDEKDLMEQYNSVVDSPQHIMSPDSVPTCKALLHFNACLVVAIGALLSSNSSSLSWLVIRLQRSATRQLAWIQDMNDLDVLHCILTLAIFSTFSPSGGSAWHLIGLAMKTCISLSLHREPDEDLQMTERTTTLRRRLFWSTYLLDR